MSKILYQKSKAKKILRQHKKCTQKYISWNEFIDSGRDYNSTLDLPFEPDTPVVMVYSSGTTGASKGIMLTNDGINATVANYHNSGFHIGKSDSFLQMIPVWFSTGIVMSVMMPLTIGITVILEPKFSKETFVKDLIKYKPSLTLTATSLWLYAITAKEMKDADLSNMKYPITGGEKVLPVDEERVNRFLASHGCNHKFFKGYGMCELGSTISGTTDAVNCIDKPGGCGYPILNAIVAVFDIDTGEELKYGEHGEIRVCSLARMKGYYKNPEATEEFFTTDSEGKVWAHTGDIGYVDQDGEVFVLGRSNDCYHNDKGKTVFLFDIENEIFRDESINQCKVINIEENGKTKLVAHIVFKKELSDTMEHINNIIRRLSDKLPAYMQPDYYKIRLSMPVHSNGKRDVESLRADREGLIDLAGIMQHLKNKHKNLQTTSIK